MGIEENLICAVERNPLIYDKTLSEYKSNNARDEAWKNVGKEMKTEDIDNLKKRWRTLRDAFIKHYRIAKTFKTGTAGGKKKKWIYYDLMLFLVPYIEFRETVHSYEDSNSQLEDSQSELHDNVREGGESPQHDTSSAISESQHFMDNSARPSTSTQSQSEPVIINNKRKQQQPCLNNNKLSKKNSTDEKLLEIVTRADDPDEQFLLSCLPSLKRLTPRNNMLARIKIQQLLFNMEYGDAEQSNSNNTRSSTRSTLNIQSPYYTGSPEGVVSGTNSGGNFIYLNNTPSNASGVIIQPMSPAPNTDDMGNIYPEY